MLGGVALTAKLARAYRERVERRALGGGAIAVVLLGSGLAFAAGPTAAELTQEGAAAAKSQRWEACVTAFAAAARLEDAPRTWGELGLCEERAARFADAYTHLRRALESAPSPTKDEPWKRYQAALSRVTEHVALVSVTVTPNHARVLLDGRPLGRGDGREIAVEPGEHTFAARLDGHEDRIERAVFRAGELPNVHLTLRPKPAPPPLLTSAKSEAAAPSLSGISPVPGLAPIPFRWCLPAPTPAGVFGPLACLSTATLLTSAITAIGFEIDRASLAERAGDSTACGPAAPSPPRVCKALDERFEQHKTAAYTTIGVGITTALLAGAAGLAIALDRGPESPKVVPTASLNGGGVFILGAW